MQNTIIVDAFGGDNAPLAMIQGCAMARDEAPEIEIALAGSAEKIKKCADENGISLRDIGILEAEGVFLMDDEPTEIIRSKKNTSMAVGLEAVASGEGGAFISAGSTGALTVGATFIAKRVKGVKRVAIATVMPSNEGPYLLIDSGANADCRGEMLCQFGAMGSVYMQKVMGVSEPRVGLLNIGTEEAKGDALRLEAYALMKKAAYSFIGNVEARQAPYGGCDVLVADGFSGNVYLKLTEGLAGALMQNIKGIFGKNLITKLAAALVMGGLRDFKRKMDYGEYGGALLLGCAKPVIKIHGSAGAKSVRAAVLQAKSCVESGVVESIREAIEKGGEHD